MERHSQFHLPRKPSFSVEGTDAELAVLQLFDDLPILTSDQIRALCPSVTFANKVLTRLAKGHYIGFPDILKDFARRYKPYPFERWPRGVELLKEKGLWNDNPHPSEHPEHRYLRSSAYHSFRVAPNFTDGLKFISQKEILSLPNCKVKEPTIRTSLGRLVPDAPLFGLSLNDAAWMYFTLEADRGTEQGKEREDGKKTISSMLKQYTAFYEERVYFHDFGLPQCFTPIFFSKSGRIPTTLERIQNEVPAKVQSRFLIGYAKDLRDGYMPANDHLLKQPLLRIRDGKVEDFSILDVLRKAANERQQKGVISGTKTKPNKRPHPTARAN